MTPERYHLTLTVGPDPLARRCERPRPVEVRLRGALKFIVRVAGFRVLSVRPDRPTDTGPSPTDTPPSPTDSPPSPTDSPLPPATAAQNASGSTIYHTDPQ